MRSIEETNIKKLERANHNVYKTDEEKAQIIKDAALAYEGFLDALQIDWRNDPNSDNTPFRVAKSFVSDLIEGCYAPDPKITAFPADGYDGIVAQTNIPLVSMCSHHHLAFTGKVHLAYIPGPGEDAKVIGLSKMNRIVEHFGRRPQIQEGLTVQIHNKLNELCEGNIGVAVMIKAQHTCSCNRGVRHHDTWMVTSKMSGAFMDKPAARSEFYKFVDEARG